MNLPFVGGFVAVVVLLLAGIWFAASSTGDILSGSLPDSGTEPSGATVQVVVGEGESIRDIGDKLEEAGVISSALRFRVLASLSGKGKEIRAGDYELPAASTAASVLNILSTAPPEVPVIQVTFPEGWRREQMADELARLDIVSRDEFLLASASLDYPFDFLAELPREDANANGVLDPGEDSDGNGRLDHVANLEGYLFPDTYNVPEGSTGEGVVVLMILNFERRVTDEIMAGFEAQGLTLHEAVTLASIIEREARVAEERPQMAGVFFNRIEAGDIFGADPTIQYVLGSSLDAALSGEYWPVLDRADIDNTMSPYNTYFNAGLPPGPISAPGLSALQAVATPAETESYFFFACGDEGVHTFSVTQAEHDRAQADCPTN